MKNSKLFTALAIPTFLLVSAISFSQDRTCGTTDYMDQQLQDPEYARQYFEKQARFEQLLQEFKASGSTSSSRMNPIIVPVAVHFPEANESDRSCLEALAQNQIDILNDDYKATNSDINLWNSASSNYPGVNPGVANIEFCIATQNHPTGLDPELQEGNPAITIGYDFGGGNNQDFNWGGYFNIVVRSIGGGVLGFSPLYGSISSGQAVTIAPSYFGSGSGCSSSGVNPSAPFNKGRTTTHEVGHFFNLSHTWGNSGGCGDDDGVSDTPNISGPTYGCPSNGSVGGCSSGLPSLTMNYMDYVNDACMYMFTEGQIDRVDSYILTQQSAFNSNVVSCGSTDPDFVLNSSTPTVETCTDEAVFEISFSTLNGFNETVSLSLSNIPNNSSASLSQTNISNDGNITMTVTGLSQLFTAQYIITVNASSASINKSLDLTISIVSGPCESSGDMEYATAIDGVLFNTLENLDASGKVAPYSDFTNLSTDLNRESTYDLSVFINTDGNYTNGTLAWIDWNQDCVLDEQTEEYVLGVTTNTANGLTTNSPLAITVPSDAILGSTTMRISNKYGDWPTPCETEFDGEVEDYTINVMTTLSVTDNTFGQLKIHPNPNNGSFALELQSTSNEAISVDIFDISGRKVYQRKFENTINFKGQINLGNVTSGLYLMTISDGERQTTKRIVIQ